MTKQEEEDESNAEKLCQDCDFDVAVKGCWNCDRLLCKSCAFSHVLPRRRRCHQIVRLDRLLDQRERDKKFKKKLREEHEKAREEFKKQEERKEEERRIAAVKSKELSSKKKKKGTRSRFANEIKQIHFRSGQRFVGRTRHMDNTHHALCLPHGKGRLYRDSGKMLYDGGWKEGKRHGIGEHYWKDGSKWIGTFRDDAKYGMGHYVPSREKKQRERKRRNSFYFDDELICEEDEMKHGQQIMLKCDRGVWKAGTLIRKTTRKQSHQRNDRDDKEQFYKVLVEDELEPRVLDLQRVRFRFEKDVSNVWSVF